MKIFLATIALMFGPVCIGQTTTSDAWINELHYDGTSTYGSSDVSEFVEIVMKNALASNPTELAKYKVVLYTSGALDQTAYDLGRGLPYNSSSSWYTEAETSHLLTGFTSCPVQGSNFTILSKTLPVLQDVPAAIALVYENTVVQLLSYEKVFKIEPAVRGGGAAAGMTTSLITRGNTSQPAMETSTTTTNHSISLIGTGDSYSSFQWDDGATVMATPCALNTNGLATQSFLTALPVRWISLAASGTRDLINIHWKVASSDGVQRYEIEVAPINGAFIKAGEVSAGTSTTGTYHSILNNVKPGTYKLRIKSVMLSGEVEYSETRVIRLGTNANPVLSVFPNPVKGGKVNVQIIPVERSSYTIQVVDVNGKVISTKQTAMFEANSLNNVSLDVSSVAQGIYHVKIINATEQHSSKIVVVK